MHKKGEGYVSLIITATILVILVTLVLVPQVKNTTSAQRYSENLVHDDAANDANFTLSVTDNLVDDSLVIGGDMTEGTNYTVDYDTGIVHFNASYVVNGTYGVVYNYYSSNYLESTQDRLLMGVVVLAVIIGILWFLFMAFGLL